MKTLVNMVFGSHMYGLNTPNSDMDYKGIFIPELRDLILDKCPKSISYSTGDNHSKNTSEDEDHEMFSLPYFLKLAMKGETVALDMLHGTPTESSPEWEFIVQNRQKFYTKNIKSYIGYLKGQVAKYGVKGSRMADVENVIQLLSNRTGKMETIWDELPELKHAKKEIHNNNEEVYVIVNRKFQRTVKIEYVFDILKTIYQTYGHRAEKAKNNEGVDWKAVSHALRAGYQLRDIYKYGDFEYPLKETQFIKDVKEGKKDFVTEVQWVLEDLVKEVQELSDKSDLPENADKEFWDDWLVSVIMENNK